MMELSDVVSLVVQTFGVILMNQMELYNNLKFMVCCCL